MDEHELERRIGARLRERFDDAAPSVALRMRIAADRSQAPVAPSRWSWLAPARAGIGGLAAVAVVVLVALTVGPRLSVGPWAASGSPTPVPTVGPTVSPSSPTPLPSPWESTYRISPAIPDPAKSTGDAAAEVVRARVRHLGIGTFSVAIGDDLTATLPGPADPRVVDALLWPGGVNAYVVPMAAALGLTVDHPVPAGLDPVFTDADVATLDDHSTEGPASRLDLTLVSAAASRLRDATTRNVGGLLAIASADGRIRHLVRIAEPLADGSVTISAGSDPADVSLEVLAAVLSAEPMPAEWSSGRLSLSSTGEPVELLAISGDGPVDGTYLVAGNYTLRYSLAVADGASAKQCHLVVDLVPVDGSGRINLVDLSVAPGTSISNSKALQIAPSAYRLAVAAECSGWSLNLQR
jgi:hypothetical protein